MALADSSPDSFSNPPPSSSTGYSNDRSSSTFASPDQPTNDGPIKIKQEHIHKIGFLNQTLCFLTHGNYLQRVSSRVAQRVENARVLTQRPPTQEEFDAMLEHCSRGVANERIGVWIALGIWSFALGSRIRKSPKFSKYVQQPPTPARLYQGFNAWHAAEPQTARPATLTNGLKTAFVGFTGLTASSAYAVYDEMEGTVHDPRLAQFLKQVKSQDREELQKRKMEARGRLQSPGSLPRVPMEDTAEVGAESSGFEEKPSEYLKRQARYTKTPTDDKPTSTTDQSQGKDFFDDDDASPVAPEYKNTSVEEVDNLGGSVWERLRQQSVAGKSQGVKDSTVVRPAPTNDAWGNSGSSSPEFGKVSEREQAQADFDRLLDAERNLGQESPKKGWGKW